MTTSYYFIIQLAANTLMYICANLVGFYHLYMTDNTHKQTFNDTRNYIQARMKLEHEKLQQVMFVLLTYLFQVEHV